MTDDMVFVMGGDSVPAGTYLAEFVKAERFTDNVEQFGPGMKLTWKILAGEHADEEVTRICSQKFSAKSNLSKLAAAIKGGPLEKGEAFQFGKYAKTQGTVLVEETEGGGSKVAAFVRQNGQAAQPQPPNTDQQAFDKF